MHILLKPENDEKRPKIGIIAVFEPSKRS